MVLTRGQRNLLEKLYFNPTQADSFLSAQSLRKHLLSQKRLIKRRQQIKVPIRDAADVGILTSADADANGNDFFNFLAIANKVLIAVS